jgi:hypothetical protein
MRLVLFACGLALFASCAAPRMSETLPPVQKVDSWKKRFNSWSKGVDFPVTVVVLPNGEGGFAAYGVDPDRRKIHFVAESKAPELMRDLAGDPTFGTVIVIDGKLLGRTEVDSTVPMSAPTSRVQVAMNLVRAAYLAPAPTDQP